MPWPEREGHDGPPTPRSLVAGDLVGARFEIVGLVGSGAFGSVYRAFDVELREKVALKVLRDDGELSSGALERFRREVTLARRVTHKNVARVFDVGEHAGMRFFTMEYVEGEALSRALVREKAFSIGTAVSIASSIAAALAAAHDVGVVHCDLKPDNVILALDGRVVLTDFGIARAHEAAHEVDRRGERFGGTPAYMAPEQMEGRDDVDGRADVYALGAILFEMIAGRKAFDVGPYGAVGSTRDREPPASLVTLRPGVSLDLAACVADCLETDPRRRPPDAHALHARLLALSTSSTPTLANVASSVPSRASSRAPSEGPPSRGASSAPRERRASGEGERSLAVLPFTGLVDEALADELRDDLIDTLSNVSGLRVRPRTAVQRVHDPELGPEALGRELDVEFVVGGTVRRVANDLRLTLRLLSVRDGFQIWARRFERPVEDALALNDEAANAIAAALAVGRVEAARGAPTNLLALDFYLRARYEYRKFWPIHQAKAIELYDRALEIAPGDPLITSGLAMALARHEHFQGSSDARALAVALEAVERAPHLGEAHLALGMVALQAGEPVRAVRELKLATRCSPGLAEAHVRLGAIVAEAGDPRRGVELVEAAATADPGVPLASEVLARAALLDGDGARAEEIARRAMRMGQLEAWVVVGRLAMWTRDRALSAKVRDALAGRATGHGPLSVFISVCDGGDPLVFENEIERLEGSMRQRSFMRQIACEVAMVGGRVEAAREHLRRSVAAGLFDAGWLDRCPAIAGLRDDPAVVEERETIRARAADVLETFREPDEDFGAP